jgi:arsenate reductase (thioredoxin)
LTASCGRSWVNSSPTQIFTSAEAGGPRMRGGGGGSAPGRTLQLRLLPLLPTSEDIVHRSRPCLTASATFCSSVPDSARFILGESILRKDGPGHFRVFSADSHPNGQVNPLGLKVLESFDYPRPNACARRAGRNFAEPDVPLMDFVFTVCANAASETWSDLAGPADDGALGNRRPGCGRKLRCPEAGRLRRCVSLPEEPHRRVHGAALKSLDKIALGTKLRGCPLRHRIQSQIAGKRRSRRGLPRAATPNLPPAHSHIRNSVPGAGDRLGADFDVPGRLGAPVLTELGVPAMPISICVGERRLSLLCQLVSRVGECQATASTRKSGGGAIPGARRCRDPSEDATSCRKVRPAQERSYPSGAAASASGGVRRSKLCWNLPRDATCPYDGRAAPVSATTTKRLS